MGDFGDAATRIRKMRDELEDNHDDATEQAMEDTTAIAKRRLQRNDNIARGEAGGLITKLTTTRVVDEDAFAAYATQAPLPALFIEYGTGQRGRETAEYPNETPKGPSEPPPYNDILQWILDKGIEPDEYDTTYGLASAIQRTIESIGTYAYPFLRPTWRTFGREQVRSQNAKAMRRAVRRYF